MTRWLTIIALIATAALYAPAAAAQDSLATVAVLDLDITGGVAENLRIPLSDRLRQELFKTGRMAVLERNRMEDILEQQSLQLAGCTSRECAVEIGRILQVRYIIAGSVGRVGELLSVNVRMFDVASSEIVVAEGLDCQCPIEELYTSGLRELAWELAEPFTPPGADGPEPVAALEVESSPDGARLLLDGVEVGRTPATINDLTRGRYSIQLEKSGYETWSRELELLPGEKRSIATTLQRRGNGKPEHLFDLTSIHQHGGFGGPELLIGTFNGETAVMMGGSGAWVVNGTWYLGGGGFGTVSRHEGPPVADPLSDSRLSLGYGGVIVGYVANTTSRTHLAFDLMIGGGAVTHSWHDPNVNPEAAAAEDTSSSNGLFMTQFMARYEVNLTSWARLDLGAGLRLAAGSEAWGVKPEELSGLVATMTVRFGWW